MVNMYAAGGGGRDPANAVLAGTLDRYRALVAGIAGARLLRVPRRNLGADLPVARGRDSQRPLEFTAHRGPRRRAARPLGGAGLWTYVRRAGVRHLLTAGGHLRRRADHRTRVRPPRLRRADTGVLPVRARPASPVYP